MYSGRMQSCKSPVDLSCSTHLAPFALRRRAPMIRNWAENRKTSVSLPCRGISRCMVTAAAAGAEHASSAEAQPVQDKGELTEFPAAAGVYAVYSPDGRLQYIGLSRKVRIIRLLYSLASMSGTIILGTFWLLLLSLAMQVKKIPCVYCR